MKGPKSTIYRASVRLLLCLWLFYVGVGAVGHVHRDPDGPRQGCVITAPDAECLVCHWLDALQQVAPCLPAPVLIRIYVTTLEHPLLAASLQTPVAFSSGSRGPPAASLPSPA